MTLVPNAFLCTEAAPNMTGVSVAVGGGNGRRRGRARGASARTTNRDQYPALGFAASTGAELLNALASAAVAFENSVTSVPTATNAAPSSR